MTKLSGTPMGLFFVVLFVILGILVLFCLLYGIFSRRFTDKIVAANMIGSLTINIIVMLAIYMAEDYILDIGLVYALLSFLAVVVLCRTITDHILGKMRHMKAQNPEATHGQLAEAGADESVAGRRLDGVAPDLARSRAAAISPSACPPEGAPAPDAHYNPKKEADA